MFIHSRVYSCMGYTLSLQCISIASNFLTVVVEFFLNPPSSPETGPFTIPILQRRKKLIQTEAVKTMGIVSTVNTWRDILAWVEGNQWEKNVHFHTSSIASEDQVRFCVPWMSQKVLRHFQKCSYQSIRRKDLWCLL